MAFRRVTDPKAVERAIKEFNALGRDGFLKKYGFGKAKEYFLIHEDELFDSKAIYGVAAGYEHPELGLLASRQFTGGEATVATALGSLGFEVRRIQSDGASREQTAALVLTSQERTSGGEYDHWKDIVGIQYHFPNKYRKLVRPGLPFVYYRGKRRKSGGDRSPEYFGVGRIGDVWLDEEHDAAHLRNRRWYCSIENYVPFAKPVHWKESDKTLERIPVNQFRDGARALSLNALTRICELAQATIPTAAILDLPSRSAVSLKPSDPSKSLLRTKRASSEQERAGPKNTSYRRSRVAKAIGDHAELIVFDQLRTIGKTQLRHHAKDGETPGYDISYVEGDHRIAVEVKGTTTSEFPYFELTNGELVAAKALADSYHVWLVANVGSLTPRFEVVKNPASMLESAELTATPVLWRIERPLK